jgi:glycosyltransferase involved in cell wall biosynthesis
LICQRQSPLSVNAQREKIAVFPVTMHGELDLKACYHIRSLIKKNQYDLIHAHTSHGHTLVYLASLKMSVPILVTRRIDFSIFRHSRLKLSLIKYRYMADYYIAISYKIKNVLVRDGIPEESIHVVHSGIDPQRFATTSHSKLSSEFALKSNERAVINVAHLAECKGQKFLIQAIPLVLKHIPNVRFFIVGGGGLQDQLQALSVELGVEDKVIFTGFRQDVEAFYHLADLFVMSSVHEGLGTAILDAAALGIPVVATEAGGIPEIIEDGVTGRLVPPADHEQLAAAIVDALIDPGSSHRMAAQGQEKIRSEFTTEAMVAGNMAVYQKILNNN